MTPETDDRAPKHPHGFNHGTIDGNWLDYGMILNAGKASVFAPQDNLYPTPNLVVRSASEADSSGTVIAIGDAGNYVYSTSGEGAGDASNSGTIVVSPVESAVKGGLTILPYFDSSVTSSPLASQYETAVNAAIAYYESMISTPVTLTIQFSLGTIAGQAMEPGALGESESLGSLQSYASVYSHLSAHDLAIGASALPKADPLTASSSYFVPFAQEQALGLITNDPLDGYIALASSQPFTFDPNNRSVSGEYDAIGVLEHEITEVMGRIALYSTSYVTAMDLFRYTSSGTLSQTENAAYFSINNGASALASYNDGSNGGDPGDWASSVVNDSYDAFTSPGGADTVSAVDLKELQAIGYTLVTCYVAGTRILTARGEVPVEALSVGDLVPTRFGGTVPIRWIGHRTVDCRRHPRRRLVAPVRVKAGAFGPGQPRRDLLLSPDHAVAMDDVLVPIRLLINGASIVQDINVPMVRYFHIELDQHDLMLAEGLAAESYLDTGNRGVFANSASPLILHPNMHADGQARREAESCLPMLTAAAAVEPLWRDLAEWAVHTGLRLPEVETTMDPGLTLLADGRALEPVWYAPLGATPGRGRYGFSIPGPVRAMRLQSRSAVPSDLRPWIEDQRCLGVMVQRLEIRSCMMVDWVRMDDERLREGWWAVERDSAQCWRWTGGDAVLPAISRASVLTVTIGETLPYALDDSTIGSTFVGDAFSELFRDITRLAV